MRRALFLLGLTTLFACQEDGVLVVVQSDLSAGSEIARLEITVASKTERISMEGRAWPVSFRVAPTSGQVALNIKALDVASGLVVERDALFEVPSGRHRLIVNLLRRCVGVSCAEPLTCGEVGCADREVLADELLSWDGEEGSELTNVPGIPDAGPSRPDASDAGFEDAAEVSGVDSGVDGGLDSGADAGADGGIDGGADTGPSDSGETPCTPGTQGCSCVSNACTGTDVYCYFGPWGNICLEAYCRSDDDCTGTDLDQCGYAGFTVDSVTLRRFPEYVCVHVLEDEGGYCAFEPDGEGRVHGCRSGLVCVDRACVSLDLCQYSTSDERGSCASSLCNPIYAGEDPQSGASVGGLCVNEVAQVGESCGALSCDARYDPIDCFLFEDSSYRCLERCRTNDCAATSLPGMPATCDPTYSVCVANCSLFPENCPVFDRTCVPFVDGINVCAAVPSSPPANAEARVESGLVVDASGPPCDPSIGCAKGAVCTSFGQSGSRACLVGCSTTLDALHPRGGCETFTSSTVSCLDLGEGAGYCGRP